MSIDELNYNLQECANDLKVDISQIEVVPKNELEIDKEYLGNCRNSNKAVWKGDYFEYQRYKFGHFYTDKINHYEDDDGYDVFVPIRFKTMNHSMHLEVSR